MPSMTVMLIRKSQRKLGRKAQEIHLTSTQGREKIGMGGKWATVFVRFIWDNIFHHREPSSTICPHAMGIAAGMDTTFPQQLFYTQVSGAVV